MSVEEMDEEFKSYSGRELDFAERARIRNVIKKALIAMGARVDFAGFDHVCVAVEMVIEEPRLLRRVCSELYPLTASIFENATGSTVERNIRSLIEDIYIEKSFCSLNRMFGVDTFTIYDKPKASELIRMLAEYYIFQFRKQL